MPGAPHREERAPLNGWYKALEDRIWLTQLGLNILLPLVLCLGGCWWAGLDFNRGPARCAGRIQRNRAGVSWHTTFIESLVCYTFVQQRAAAWGSSALVS